MVEHSKIDITKVSKQVTFLSTKQLDDNPLEKTMDLQKQ
jgi:hypothetical protein